ncbi:conserved hypothetical protein [Vibrio crassostreae]|nr:conserved hypothetical protein [Vibrio crassostreae]
MKFKIMAIIISCLTINSISAKDLDLLSVYKDRCVNEYKRDVRKHGTSQINGMYLEYKGQDQIKEAFKSLHFSPDYNLQVTLNGDRRNGIKMIDVVSENDTVVFYDQKSDKRGDRNGSRWTVKHVAYNTYELSISYSNRSVRNKDRTFTPVFDEAIEFGEGLTVLTLNRNIEKEENLNLKHSSFKVNCLKK